MDKKQEIHQQSIVDICDKLIENAQTILMNQTEHSNEVTLVLNDYTDEKASNEEIINYLTIQEIRLYEDECDENGMIVNSKEIFSRIFENIEIVSEHNTTYINLFFSQGMMNLLT